jgi:hypothetical protein
MKAKPKPKPWRLRVQPETWASLNVEILDPGANAGVSFCLICIASIAHRQIFLWGLSGVLGLFQQGQARNPSIFQGLMPSGRGCRR